jgi:hypothetical protein
MESSKQKYHPIELDEQAEPRWKIPIPRKPSFSATGHALPFSHPKLNNVRPAPWPFPYVLSLLTDFTVVTPLGLLAEAALIGLNRGRDYPSIAGVSCFLQRVFFWATTCYRSWDDQCDSIKAGIVFPGKVAALPVDAAMVEPVFALYTLGLPIIFCYEGYGLTLSGIRLKAGYEFPQSLLNALDEAGTPYVQISGENEPWRELVACSVDSDFTSVLREWSRKVCLDATIPPLR